MMQGEFEIIGKAIEQMQAAGLITNYIAIGTNSPEHKFLIKLMKGRGCAIRMFNAGKNRKVKSL